MKNIEKNERRLKDMFTTGASASLDKIENVLRGELCILLKQYLQIDAEDINCKLIATSSGVKIEINGMAKRVKRFIVLD